KFELVRGGAGDGMRAAKLHAESWKTAYRGIVSDAYLDTRCEADRIEYWTKRMAAWDPARAVLIFARAADGTDLGFSCALLDKEPEHGVLLDNLHVRPALKRGGVGRALIAATGRWVAATSPGTPMHLTVYRDNPIAVSFYRRMGGVEHDAGIENFKDGTSAPISRFVWSEPEKIAD
ncbi:MAG: GNAT family N-acetyltransferase, partial [Tagaea sp.]|nr:GNAT family N-acetyltransferase [Tagaea sp.]